MEPEQKLYVHIIIQALEDLTSTNPIEKIQAKAWFINNSEDYKDICDGALYNSTMLRKKVLTAKPEQLRELVNEYTKTVR